MLLESIIVKDRYPFILMMTSSNGNFFRVTGHLCGEFTGPRWIPRTKASNAELWCFYLICTRINGWVNNGEAGDLGHHRAHYDVTVMMWSISRLPMPWRCKGWKQRQPGTHFMTVIHIRWKFHSTLTQVKVKRSLLNFVHDTTAVLS